MGIDYRVCSECKSGFTDVIDYEFCGCGREWCDEECAELGGLRKEYDDDGDYDGEGTCKYCRKEDATDSELLGIAAHLLGNISREDLVRAYYAFEEYEDYPEEDE